jgi:hypothetical protein
MPGGDDLQRQELETEKSIVADWNEKAGWYLTANIGVYLREKTNKRLRTNLNEDLRLLRIGVKWRVRYSIGGR